MRQSWEKPQLVVLVRGRAEEAVLDPCKYGYSPPGVKPNVDVNGCKLNPGATPDDPCGATCSNIGIT